MFLFKVFLIISWSKWRSSGPKSAKASLVSHWCYCHSLPCSVSPSHTGGPPCHPSNTPRSLLLRDICTFRLPAPGIFSQRNRNSPGLASSHLQASPFLAHTPPHPCVCQELHQLPKEVSCQLLPGPCHSNSWERTTGVKAALLISPPFPSHMLILRAISSLPESGPTFLNWLLEQSFGYLLVTHFFDDIHSSTGSLPSMLKVKDPLGRLS